MGEPLTQKMIDQFYADYDKIDLKFPIAEIARATGFSKGNVSAYLSKKMQPSANFLKKFYEAFGESSKKVPRGTETPQISTISGNAGKDEDLKEVENKGSLRQLIESNAELATANRKLADAHLIIAQIMERTSTGYVQPESSKALETILPGLQKILVQLGMGRLWKNEKDGEVKVSKWLFGNSQKNEVGRIHDGSHK